MPSYTQRDLENAMEAVRSNRDSLSSASSKYNIPRTTLHYKLRGRASRQEAREPQQALSAQAETFLAKRILEFSKMGCSPTHRIVRRMAMELVDGEPLGQRWVYNFLRRQPSLKALKGIRIDYERMEGVTHQKICTFFEVYYQEPFRSIKEENIFNMDETGLMMGQASTRTELVIGSATRKRVFTKNSPNREWVSIIECISATGVAVRPLVIFKGINFQAQWMPSVEEVELTSWEFKCTPRGWTDNITAMEWLTEIFIPSTRPEDAEDWRLLILDGHVTHSQEDFMVECWKHKIYLCYLIPHSSHVLQPLDVGVFGPLKRAYKDQIDITGYENPTAPIDKVRFVKCYAEARERAFSAENIKSGFRATGMYPRNRHAALSSAHVSAPRPEPSSLVGSTIGGQLAHDPGVSTVLPPILQQSPVNEAEFNQFFRFCMTHTSSLSSFQTSRAVRQLNNSVSSILVELRATQSENQRLRAHQVSNPRPRRARVPHRGLITQQLALCSARAPAQPTRQDQPPT